MISSIKEGADKVRAVHELLFEVIEYPTKESRDIPASAPESKYQLISVITDSTGKIQADHVYSFEVF